MSHAVQASAAGAVFPTTSIQRRLWSQAHDHGDAISKNIAVQWELQGRFTDAGVEAAFQAVFDRHEILRTRFVERDGTLVQEVVGQVDFHLGTIDLRSLQADQIEPRIRQIAVELAGSPFDMGAPGQLRACLVRIAGDRARLLIATHYGVFDGYSIKVLGREIGRLIAAHQTGVAARLPELALQYGDYAAWRAACLDSGALEETRAFWHDRLRDAPYFELPTDRPRQPGEARLGRTLTRPMPADFSARLDEAARAANTSTFALGAAVMAAALHGATGADRVGFTTCVAGREEEELEPLIGVFVNPVVLRFDCEGASVADLVKASRRIVAEALGHGDYPIDLLAEELGQAGDPARTPFVAPFFSLQTVFVEEQDYGALRIVSVPSHTPQATHDIAVQVIGRASGWHMVVDYDAALFDEPTVRGFADRVAACFEAAFDAPQTPLATLRAAAGSAAVDEAPHAPTPGAVADAGPAAAPAARRASRDTVARLAAIWTEIAGTAPSGGTTDFFEIGGSSLSSLRMLTRVRTEFGVKIDIAAFFEDPTLGGLARRIDLLNGTAEDADAPAGIWDVISLRRPESAAAPLVVSFNQPFLYRGVARTLDGDAEVVNLHVPDADVLNGGDGAVLETLLGDAAAILEDRARGRRLILVGHCVDGTLSLLVAQRLAARGLTPELVAAIDCWRPGANAELSPARLRRRRQAERLRRYVQTLRARLSGEIGWIAFLSRLKPTRVVLERLGRIDPPTEAEKTEWAVNARLVQLVQGAALAPYAGPVALFATGGQAPDARARLFGWDAILPADTPIYDLPGWHEYALRSHGYRRVAAILSCRLGRRSG